MLLAPPPAPFVRAAAPPESPPARPPAPGLTSAEAAHRLQQVGANVLAASAQESLLWLAARQFYSLTGLVLGGAGAASVLGGDYLEGAAIGAVVLLNAAIGFGLEWQARAAMEALHALDVPHARALRDGQPRRVPAAWPPGRPPARAAARLRPPGPPWPAGRAARHDKHHAVSQIIIRVRAGVGGEF